MDGRRWSLLAVGAAYVAYFNYWMWDDDSLVLGVPVNLLYQVLLTISFSVVMWALVRWGWPSDLDED